MLDLLNKMAAAPAAGGKKSAKPEVSDPSIDANLDAIIDAKKKLAQFEAVLETNEAQARAKLLPTLRKVCRDARKVMSSIRVNGKLTLTSQCRYSAVPAEHAPALRDAFGNDYDRYFKSSLKIGLTEGAAADEAFLASLIAAVGETEFMRRFTVTRTLHVTEALHDAMTLDPAVEAKAAPFIGSEIIRQASPSFRV